MSRLTKWVTHAHKYAHAISTHTHTHYQGAFSAFQRGALLDDAPQMDFLYSVQEKITVSVTQS